MRRKKVWLVWGEKKGSKRVVFVERVKEGECFGFEERERKENMNVGEESSSFGSLNCTPFLSQWEGQFSMDLLLVSRSLLC